MTPAAHVAVGVVRTYQWTLRPFIGANCRFWPSCSEYAIEAFRIHGALHGGASGDPTHPALQSVE